MSQNNPAVFLQIHRPYKGMNFSEMNLPFLTSFGCWGEFTHPPAPPNLNQENPHQKAGKYIYGHDLWFKLGVGGGPKIAAEAGDT